MAGPSEQEQRLATLRDREKILERDREKHAGYAKRAEKRLEETREEIAQVEASLEEPDGGE